MDLVQRPPLWRDSPAIALISLAIPPNHPLAHSVGSGALARTSARRIRCKLPFLVGYPLYSLSFGFLQEPSPKKEKIFSAVQNLASFVARTRRGVHRAR